MSCACASANAYAYACGCVRVLAGSLIGLSFWGLQKLLLEQAHKSQQAQQAQRPPTAVLHRGRLQAQGLGSPPSQLQDRALAVCLQTRVHQGSKGQGSNHRSDRGRLCKMQGNHRQGSRGSRLGVPMVQGSSHRGSRGKVCKGHGGFQGREQRVLQLVFSIRALVSRERALKGVQLATRCCP